MFSVTSMSHESIDVSASDAIRRATQNLPPDMIISAALRALANFYPQSSPPGKTQWTPGYLVRGQLDSIAAELE